MVDEHRHEHEHEHDHPHRHDPAELPQPVSREEDLDAAGRSLSDALRISFAILKVIMIILVVAFLASGFKTVGSDEKALVLRFGKVRGVGQEAILGPGAHWVFPYPIDELVRIPVEKNINLRVNTFWYKETRDDILGGGVKPRNYVPEQLDPVQEGYCLTGSLRAAPAGTTATVQNVVASGPRLLREGDGSDYNIVHTRWEVNYQITGVEQFFRNVYVQEAKPGEVYFAVMNESITPMLRSLVEDAVVKATVHYTIDEVLQSTDTIRRRVQQLLQQKLDTLESGIRVVQVQLVEVKWPKQVDQAFEEFITASQTSGQTVTQARTYAETTLTKTAGQIAESLYRALYNEPLNEQQLADLWAQVTGDVQDTVTQAQTYQTRVVERARANAMYLADILPEYRQRPELVTRDLYLTAIQQVLANADETFIIDKCNNVKEREVRVMVTRDPSLKPKQNQSNAAVK
ncbi:MAG: SPFH domain-containing protein [Planctomycetes bacterium]|jgi:membrane protease subunit HflK|nr:SPFH domain-containing protein [Planctomycetota bacterium]